MKRILITATAVVALVVSTMLGAFSANAQERFGRYEGVVSHDRLGKQQRAKLDFVMASQAGDELELFAVLTLFFGDYGSKEYASYHFDNVRYNLLTGDLAFNQPDQDVSLALRWTNENTLEGTLRSNVTIGAVKLTNTRQPITATAPLIEPLWGEYRGTCQGIVTTLQLQTARSTQDSSRVGNPFGSYEIRGQVAESDCIEGFTCVMGIFDTGTYDFFRGSLHLSGSKSWQCEVGTDSMACNGCTLTRVSSESSGPRVATMPTSQSRLATIHAPETDDSPALEVPAASISGEYYGFVHHEYLDRYQAVTFNIATSQGRNGELLMLAVANLHFGGFDSNETIPYRFDERPYPLLAPRFVFQRIGSDVDAMVQVTAIGDGRIEGVWYSILFGRVGTFEVRKGTPPELPDELHGFDAVGGVYTHSFWDEVRLQVRPDRTPVNTENPFFPLSFGGHFYDREAIGRVNITGGSYDFYTGRIGIFRGGGGTMYAGDRVERNQLSLKEPTVAITAPLLPHRLSAFYLLGE